MAAPTPERRAAMRALYEHNHIDPALIARIAGYQTATVEQYVANQNWTRCNPLAALRETMIGKMQTLIDRFGSADSNPADDEKLARTLTNLLKSLEQMNGLNPVSDREETNTTKENIFALGLAGGADHTAELDRRLASLLTDAAQQEET